MAARNNLSHEQGVCLIAVLQKYDAKKKYNIQMLLGRTQPVCRHHSHKRNDVFIVTLDWPQG